MNLTVLGHNVDATAVAAQTAVDFGAAPETPWTPGYIAIGMILGTAAVAGAAGVAKIQTSPDNSVWTDAITSTAGVKIPKMGEVTLDRYVRLNVTVGWTDGLVSAYLII